ncbi:hypothetical protein HID58_071078 [Brassica napus]|uniref:Uncharacterized protein n=1 Tax=Brassica napus TaxID=3708 RepID=A0ABQ7Z0K2_BRANA|nr:hypothetical protein HID58_071078 [Brassica napus]
MPATVAASWVPTFGPHLMAGSIDATSLKVLTEPSFPLPEECFRFRSRSEMLALANTSSQLSDNIGEITAVKSSVSDPPGDKNHSDGDAQTQPSHVCTATIHMRLGDNVKKGDDIPVDNTVPAEVETGGSSQQAAPDATAVPNGKEPQEPSAKAARFMIWQQSYFISKNAFASMLVFF